MYADSKCSCFFAELVNALVMVHPLYFFIVPGFSDNVIVSYSESTVCCVSIEIWDFKMEAYYLVCIFSKLKFYNVLNKIVLDKKCVV